MSVDADPSGGCPPPGAKMEMAFRASSRSPNRVRQVRAVLVARDGAEIVARNTFPAGVGILKSVTPAMAVLFGWSTPSAMPSSKRPGAA